MIVNPLRIFAALFFVVVGVSAQTACVVTCLQGALSSNTCTAFTDISCVCSNTAFQAAAAACLQANCTAADQASAQALQQAQCASTSSTTSGSSVSRPTSSGSSTSSSSTSSSSRSTTSSSSSAASSATPTSGAVHAQVPFLNSAFALAVVALGGAFIL